MSKYFLQLQTPTVELTVTGKDASGAAVDIAAGINRYEIEDAQEKFEQFNTINKELADVEADVAAGNIVDKTYLKTLRSETASKITEFLKNEVVYLKKVQLMEETSPGIYQKGPLIPDTRTWKDDSLWKEKHTSCLDFLLDMLLASSVWRGQLISAVFSAFANTKLGKEAEAKN
jgi:hypothetical protein